MSSPSSGPPALASSTENCQVADAMAVLGRRATLVVLREVFAGVRRFDDMHRHTGVSRQVLTDRLTLLVEHDVLRKVPYRVDGGRERHEYQLTDKGLDLYPVLSAVGAWGTRHYGGPEGPPMQLVHRECGALVETTMRCTSGHEVPPRGVATAVGPGARPATGH